ncbi:MAG: hypothetical protein JXR94_07160 [Candidatus Hydrogenedentes bacterium]|nr:hypothetical protein [Candidatus Hydrogenedentota bacterium]
MPSDTTMIDFDCAYCGGRLAVPAGHSGRHAWCDACRRVVFVPPDVGLRPSRQGRRHDPGDETRPRKQGEPPPTAGKAPDTEAPAGQAAHVAEWMATERAARSELAAEVQRLRSELARVRIDADSASEANERARDLVHEVARLKDELDHVRTATEEKRAVTAADSPRAGHDEPAPEEGASTVKPEVVEQAIQEEQGEMLDSLLRFLGRE